LISFLKVSPDIGKWAGPAMTFIDHAFPHRYTEYYEALSPSEKERLFPGEQQTTCSSTAQEHTYVGARQGKGTLPATDPPLVLHHR
jgi:hypothetical protein